MFFLLLQIASCDSSYLMNAVALKQKFTVDRMSFRAVSKRVNSNWFNVYPNLESMTDSIKEGFITFFYAYIVCVSTAALFPP